MVPGDLSDALARFIIINSLLFMRMTRRGQAQRVIILFN